MKSVGCIVGLVVFCVLKATLVWISCWRGGAHRHGTGVLGLEQPRGPGGVTVAVVKKEKPASKSASFFAISKRRGSESARFPRGCTSNMLDFIGYSSKIGFIRPYRF